MKNRRVSYLASAARATVPQSEQLRGDQVANSAGGFVWEVTPWQRLRRFLILGSEGGTYYIGEHKLTRENITALGECLAQDGLRTVEEILDVSTSGRAPRNDQAIFALAHAIANGDEDTKAAALDVVPEVCRIGTHLFMLCEFIDELSGWGRAKRRAIANWYETMAPDKLAYQLVKYRQRGGWTHRDVLRLTHPKGASGEHKALYSWAVSGNQTLVNPGIHNPALYETYGSNGAEPFLGTPLAYAEGYMNLVYGDPMQKETDPVATIRKYRLPREAVPTELLKRADVWEALLENMPMTAMIRNLGNMTRVGLLAPSSNATAAILGHLGNPERIARARIHPFSVLLALKTYAAGRGYRSRGEGWSPVPQIVDALDGTFYTAFGNVAPTNRKILLGLDVSGSMGSPIANTNITAREGATAMALVTAAAEPMYECVAFATGGWQGPFGTGGRFASYGSGLVPVALSKHQRLDDALAKTAALPFGGTDCALPMLYALDAEREVETFIVYTDSETWAGKIHPSAALQTYRRRSGIDAKLVVVAMTSNGFTIADPNDTGMLDVVGFDAATPNVISEFALGNV